MTMASNSEPHPDLKSLMNEALRLRNVNHEKLSQLTGISERYILALQNIEVEKLPPPPYVRGYIKKISEVLDLNHDEIWELYKKELSRGTSGKYDTLPENRFAIRHLSRKQIFSAALGLFFIAYLLSNAGRLIGKPDLQITFPESPIFTTIENRITLAGNLDQKDKLTINGEEVFISQDGTFLKEYELETGDNIFEFKAVRFLGSDSLETRRIIYQPPAEFPEARR